MNKLLLLCTLLTALLLPSASHAQAVLLGAPCGAGGLTGITPQGVPVTCQGSPLRWTSPTGAGSISNTPSPVNGFDPNNYSNGLTVNDAQMVIDGVTAGGGGHTVTSASAHFFTNAKVNQKIFCATPNNSLLGMPVSTITAVTSDTVVTTNGSDNGAISSQRCVWYSNDAAPAFQAAFTAAASNAANTQTGSGPQLNSFPGNVLCPKGGYAVGSRVFNQVGAGTSISPSFIGDGPSKCIFYPIPTVLTDPGDGFAILISDYNSVDFEISGFTVEGYSYPFSFTHPLVQFNTTQRYYSRNISIRNYGTTGTTSGALSFLNSANATIENPFVQNSPTAAVDFACDFNGTSALTIINPSCSNHFKNVLFANNQNRTLNGKEDVVIGGFVDECGATGAIGCTVLQTNGAASFVGTQFFVGNSSNTAISVDGTSALWLTDVACGQFGSNTTTTNCLTIASGGVVYASQSKLYSNGASTPAVSGPAGATFVDVGGNLIQNCVSGTCTTVTPANYATLAFSGGIVPKATVTHTPNTCYAAGGNLLATAQNLCTLLLDQNYQVLNITAGQTGTAVTTSCTGAPVVTLSDGTRSATLTLTTGNTSWSSTGLSTVFASGATLTVSIGANTCATPPTGVFVNYVLQSVLNP